jgi:predicted MFS family arabinose efflux permease
MSEPPDGPASKGPEPGETHIGLAVLLAETFTVQALGTASVLTIATLAPAVAQQLGVSSRLIGYQVGLVYFGSMLMSLFAGSVVSHAGPCRTGQIAMMVAAAGCALASAGNIPSIICGSLVIGLGYGLTNPAASELLMRHSPPHRRNLIFSIKQTGVPFGGISAALLAPSAALMIGWERVLWLVAAICLLVAMVAQHGRDQLDRPGERIRQASRFSFDAIVMLLRSPTLRALAFASFCFSAVQLCAVAFLVSLLVEDLGFDLVSAGMILAAMQVAGAVGRILWGIVADAVGDGLIVLLGLALMMAVAAAAILAFGARSPTPFLIANFLLLGISGIGWNGVFMSEVARSSRPDSVGTTTGAAMFFTFTGVVVGPTLFSIVHQWVGTYTRAYGLMLLGALAGALMIASVRLRRTE